MHEEFGKNRRNIYIISQVMTTTYIVVFVSVLVVLSIILLRDHYDPPVKDTEPKYAENPPM